MSVEKVRRHLAACGLEDRVMEFNVSSATVELAARALGTEGARIAKTLSLHSGEGCILLVMAGDSRIDNRKFKDRFSMKARMLSGDEALAMTGHAVGGVCPFALPEGVRVYLDVALKRFAEVFPAAGSAASAVRLAPDELFSAVPGAEWVDVAKVEERENRE